MFQEICIPDEDSPFFMSTTLRLMHELDILASVKDYHLLRLRGGRSYADSAKGTRPFGIPFSACRRDLIRLSSLLRCTRPARTAARRVVIFGRIFRP